jgi:dihydropyrimidinase
VSGRTLLRGGTVVTVEGEFAVDVLVEDGKVAAIGRELGTSRGTKVLDVSGALVFPGGVDVHTHLDAPLVGTVTADNFESGSIAAAFGGTTTIVDFALHRAGRSLRATVDEWKERAKGQTVIDYGFHASIVELNEAIMNEIPELIAEGVTSFKCFTAYRGALMVDDGTLFRLLRVVKSANGLVMVHAESGDVIDALISQALSSGQTEPRYHAATRPPETEEEAVARCIALAAMAESPLYVVHVSTAGGVNKIREGQSTGWPLYAETCPHYLYLSEEVYERPGFEGAKYVCSPPIREKRHSEHLWNGLRNGSIQVLASDHCPFNFTQKKMGQASFAKIPNGVPSLEARFILGYHGASEGKISLSRFVNVVSTAPAKLSGLYPRKGTLMPGADADLVVVDPAGQTVLSTKTLHERVDYTPYEGMTVNGSIRYVMVRGEFVIEDRKLAAGKGYGQFLKRGPCIG